MAREHLEGRDNWQDEANKRGSKAETGFSGVMRQYFVGTNFSIEDGPRDLARIYGQNRGIRPDHAIRNRKTGKAVYVEVKRQRAAGNAHERACKYMMPGILSSARDASNQPAHVIPIWWIFTNGIAIDERYRREIMHWFRGIEGHVLLWQDINDSSIATSHFEKYIRRFLL